MLFYELYSVFIDTLRSSVSTYLERGCRWMVNKNVRSRAGCNNEGGVSSAQVFGQKLLDLKR